MHFFNIISKCLIVVAVSVVITGCNPGTSGWKASAGGKHSSASLLAARQKCRFQRARRHALHLLDAPGDRHKNEMHATRILEKAEQCMRRYGFYPGSVSGYYGVGRLPIR